MPATLVHPAAVLPVFYLARKHLALSALIIGSLSPDFEYLVFWGGGSRFSHSMPGLIFCVPAALLALWLFHALVKWPMLELLPEWHRRRFRPLAGYFAWLPAKRFVLIIVALAIGAFSHLAWDSFTHYRGWGVLQFPALEHELYVSGRMHIRVYNMLQYVGSVVGLVALVACYWFWARRAPAPDEPTECPVNRRMRVVVWAGIVLIPLELGLAMGLIMRGDNFGAFGTKLLVAGTAMGAHIGLYATMLAYGTGFTLWQWNNARVANKIASRETP